jgi:hypothetical protein
MSWSPYPKDRKILQKDGYSIVVPASFEHQKVMPIFCDVCEFRFNHIDDEENFKRFGCCSSCADQWAYSNKEKWLTGWRPSGKQISEHVEKRKFSNQNIRFI